LCFLEKLNIKQQILFTILYQGKVYGLMFSVFFFPKKVSMSTKNGKVRVIVHSAASAAALAAAPLAQIPGSDNAVITPIQLAMIIAIGEVHGQQLSKSVALSTLSAASAGVVGRTVSQFLIGWIPGYGNAVNASTAFAITEAIGWAANSILEKNPDDSEYPSLN
jgi:uncharacterized protein (DUF697 family)